MDVCVCLSGADGRVVEGRATLFRPPPPDRQGSNPGRMGHPWMPCCVRIVSSREEKGEERVKLDQLNNLTFCVFDKISKKTSVLVSFIFFLQVSRE
jgi:hypothetical protein